MGVEAVVAVTAGAVVGAIVLGFGEGDGCFRKCVIPDLHLITFLGGRSIVWSHLHE